MPVESQPCKGSRFNESMGRAVGDTLLAAVEGRLSALVCERDAVGHWGGDKFVVVCESTVPGERARLVADILKSSFAELELRFK